MYLKEIWQCRHFWLSLVRMDLRNRYRRSFLGMGWALLHPIAMTIILCTVFHRIFQTDVRHYAPFLLAGLSCWQFLCAATIQGCQSLFQNESYIRQQPLPAAVYPLRTVLGAIIQCLFAVGVTVGLSWVLNGPGNLAALPALIPGIALLFLFGWALAIVAAFINVYFRDTQHLCEIGLQVLYFATPVIYEPRILANSDLSWVLKLNPLTPFLELIREPTVNGQAPLPQTFGLAVGVTALATGAAALTIALFQKRFIFRL